MEEPVSGAIYEVGKRRLIALFAFHPGDGECPLGYNLVGASGRLNAGRMQKS